MIRCLLDANVLIDALLDDADRKHGDRINAQLILEAVAQKKIIGVISPVIIASVIHVVKPRRKEHRDQMEKAIEFLLDICEWAPIDPEHYRTSMASSFKDIEDGVAFFAAGGGSLSAIITRDIKDFKEHVHIPVLTPSQFVQKHLR